MTADRIAVRRIKGTLPFIPRIPTDIKIMALRGIEWVELAFPDVNMLVRVNVNVPEEVWSHALKAKFRKHPCKQKLSGAIFRLGRGG
ncbi:MAG: hypothetical protein RL326_2241 [Pseudomonadota bacterium]